MCFFVCAFLGWIFLWYPVYCYLFFVIKMIQVDYIILLECIFVLFLLTICEPCMVNNPLQRESASTW